MNQPLKKLSPKEVARINELVSSALRLTSGERIEFIQKQMHTDPVVCQEAIEIINLYSTQKRVDQSWALVPIEGGSQLAKSENHFENANKIKIADSQKRSIENQTDTLQVALLDSDNDTHTKSIHPPSSNPTVLPIKKLVGDFYIERVLGRGAFATVYLATQNSLRRKVALKVSANEGVEAKTLAHLEHDNIVKVYSCEENESKGQNLICMQYVPGTTLERVLLELPKLNGTISGKSFIKIVDDESMGHESSFDPKSLKDREYIVHNDYLDVALWMGKEIAQALHYAHNKGVLHLDVKPGNILISPYGRPLLTDFNVSLSEQSEENSPIGGTVRFMAPEQKAIFHAETPKEMSKLIQKVDRRTDVFGLGMLLKKMITEVLGKQDSSIHRVLQKATSSDPQKRYQSAEEMGKALSSCIEMRKINRRMGGVGPILKLAHKHPILALSIFGALPQILATIISTTYNEIYIVSKLSPSQMEIFQTLLNVYNPVMYAIGAIIWVYLLIPPIKFFKQPELYFSHPDKLKDLRNQVLNLPHSIVELTVLGWTLGIFLFPVTIDSFGSAIDMNTLIHFLMSMSLSCLIALCYSMIYTKFVVIRLLYPRMWEGCTDIRQTCKNELGSKKSFKKTIYALPALVPLFGAAWILAQSTSLIEFPKQLSMMIQLSNALIAISCGGILFGFIMMHHIDKAVTAFLGNHSEHESE